MAETYEAARGKFASKIAMKDAKSKAARKPGQKRVTRYREAFAGAAKRNSGGKY